MHIYEAIVFLTLCIFWVIWNEKYKMMLEIFFNQNNQLIFDIWRT